jgi:hypothetical protein
MQTAPWFPNPDSKTYLEQEKSFSDHELTPWLVQYRFQIDILQSSECDYSGKSVLGIPPIISTRSTANDLSYLFVLELDVIKLLFFC